MSEKSRKPLPVGESDFRDLINQNYYYVDKTDFIREVLEKKAKVLLVCRPRRFGKTLNMSTLKYFLTMKDAEENRKLFRGLNIEKTEFMSHQGKYPVIYLTLKELTGVSYDDFLRGFKRLISKLFKEHKHLKEFLDTNDLEAFEKIVKRKDDGDYDIALQFLSELYEEYIGIKPVLLIDEYDSPMIVANEKGYYEEVKELFGIFYGSALKDAPISFAVVTGILRVAKESIFSSLNNLEVSTILTEDFNHFGMNEIEVQDILEYYGRETGLEAVKTWYNGYTFGEGKVYNPWSIINHSKSGKLISYWVNTSANSLIMQLLKDAEEDINDIFYELLRGGVAKTILDDNMIFGQKYSNSTVLYLMFSAGYLTIDRAGERRREYYLRIPNLEVKDYFRKTFIEIADIQGESSFMILEDALISGKVSGNNSIEARINKLFKSSMSYLDGAKEEKFYHNLILGMMIGLDNSFYIHSNREEGLGRYDLALEPRDKNGIGYIFEFKVAASTAESDLDKAGAAALAQIDDKVYELGLRERGIEKIIKIGMVFSSKIMKLYIK
ncbi:MAG: AAA family ATPase [Cetobacterium sp.]